MRTYCATQRRDTLFLLCREGFMRVASRFPGHVIVRPATSTPDRFAPKIRKRPKMPGPCNKKKRRRTVHKTQKMTKNSPEPGTKLEAETCDSQRKPGDSSSLCSRTPSQHLLTPPPIPYCPVDQPRQPKDWENLYTFDDADPKCLDDDFLLPAPYIYDPGNGPRVRDTHAFLSSKYFAQEPAIHVRHCTHRQDSV